MSDCSEEVSKVVNDSKDATVVDPLLNGESQTPVVVASSNGGAHDTEEASAMVVVPPDGGWGWVVVAASFVCNFVVDGIIFCFGLFKEEIMKTLGISEAQVALVGSLLQGFYLMAGPFVSALANRYGFRSVTILGAILAAGGFAIASRAEDVSWLYLFYGVVGGIGFGMIYSPSIITVGFYFERWRALATGIAVCGSGIGNFTLAPLMTVAILKMGWSWALCLQAGIILVCTICGALFRPLKPIKITLEKESDDVFASPPNNLLMKIKKARDEDFQRSESVSSLDKHRILRANNNSEYPTAAELLNITERPDSSATDTTKMSKSTQSLNINNIIIGHNISLVDQPKRLSMPAFPEKEKIGHAESKILQSLKSEEKDIGKRKRNTSESSMRSRRGTVTECTIRSRRGTITQLEDSVNRPLYRDDIFFTASLHRLPQYNSEKDLMGYTMSVTRLPTQKDLEEEGEFQCCPEAVQRTIATMLDLSLLKSPSILLLCFSGFLTLMGFFSPFMFLMDRAVYHKMPDSQWLLSSIGITNTIGRIVCGILSSSPKVDALLVNNIALVIGGLATILSGVSMTPSFQYLYCVLFGISIACFASLRSIIIVDLLGLEKLTNAFGVLLLFQGVAALIGAPLAGYIKDVTGSFDAPFYFSGTLLVLSGLITLPLKAINRREKMRNKEKAEKSLAI